MTDKPQWQQEAAKRAEEAEKRANETKGVTSWFNRVAATIYRWAAS